MTQDTHNQLKPETEVLRIEGNVTVPKGEVPINRIHADLVFFINDTYDATAILSIVSQDDESGMRLYRVEEVDKLKQDLQFFIDRTSELESKNITNNLTYYDLAEQLRQEKEKYDRIQKAYALVRDKSLVDGRTASYWKTKAEIWQYRAENKAGLKRAWKWFYEECLIHWFKPNQH